MATHNARMSGSRPAGGEVSGQPAWAQDDRSARLETIAMRVREPCIVVLCRRKEGRKEGRGGKGNQY